MPANPPKIPTDSSQEQELPEIEPLLDILSSRVSKLVDQIETPVVVGIHTGGLWLARFLAARLGINSAVGELDIGFHRDDFGARGLTRPIRPSRIDGTVEGRSVLLVDDVIHTGRTIRAAINSIYDFGRPGRILLAVLIDRAGRQLPFQPDVAAVRLDLPPDQQIRLKGPEPLALEFSKSPQHD